MDRPEYITCVRHTHEDKKKMSWCGRNIQDVGFYFVDIDHAAYDQLDKDRLLICPECLAEIIKALKTQDKEKR